MQDNFAEGYNFYIKNCGAGIGGINSTEYINSIKTEIDKLVDDLNQFKGFKTQTSKLSGDAAEFFHGGTFNINAKIKGSGNYATVNRSHDFGSADLTLKSGEKIGSKFNSSGSISAHEQAKTIYERYKYEQAKGNTQTLQEYCDSRGVDSNDVYCSMYQGQIRLIPAGQLEDAINYLERKIAKESIASPERAKMVSALEETKKLLTDRIKDKNGVESVPITKSDINKITQLAKEGNITEEELAKYGISMTQLISIDDILRQAGKAGLQAAILSLVLKAGPELFKAITYLIKNGEVDEQQLRSIGSAAISGASEGFIKGSITAAITTTMKAGFFGESLKSINGTAVAFVVTVLFETVNDSIDVTSGKITQFELTQNLTKNLVVGAFSMGLGITFQALLPELCVVGYMVGSFIGSVIGSFVYNCVDNIIISFCIKSGFTLFGLMQQDYSFSDDLLDEMGVKLINVKKFEYKTNEIKYNNYLPYNPVAFNFESIEIIPLKRSRIAVNKIAYA